MKELLTTFNLKKKRKLVSGPKSSVLTMTKYVALRSINSS